MPASPRLGLKDAGFTEGGFKPAHFPLVAAWNGGRVYLADGGGLNVIDLLDPDHPRLLRKDRLARPAIDAVVAGNELDVLRAGPHPAVLRYRLDVSGLPTPAADWSLPAGSRPAAIARHDAHRADTLITEHERGFQIVPASEFSAISKQP
jgi:hypothetical protein